MKEGETKEDINWLKNGHFVSEITDRREEIAGKRIARQMREGPRGGRRRLCEGQKRRPGSDAFNGR